MKGRPHRVKEEKAKFEADPKHRAKVFQELLLHVKRGFSLDCFKKMSLTAICEALLKHPEEFDKEELEQAQREAKEGWEHIGRRQAEGTCLGNSRSWFYNMSHRYGWSDRVDVKAEVQGSLAVNIVSYASTTDKQP